jgi:hypothetical protein
MRTAMPFKTAATEALDAGEDIGICVHELVYHLANLRREALEEIRTDGLR